MSASFLRLADSLTGSRRMPVFATVSERLIFVIVTRTGHDTRQSVVWSGTRRHGLMGDAHAQQERERRDDGRHCTLTDHQFWTQHYSLPHRTMLVTRVCFSCLECQGTTPEQAVPVPLVSSVPNLAPTTQRDALHFPQTHYCLAVGHSYSCHSCPQRCLNTTTSSRGQGGIPVEVREKFPNRQLPWFRSLRVADRQLRHAIASRCIAGAEAKMPTHLSAGGQRKCFQRHEN